MPSTLQNRVVGGLALGTALLPLVGRAMAAPRGYTGSTAESNARLAEMAGDGDGWYAAASSTPPATTCSINASAVAFVQSVETGDGTFVRSLAAQINADIHNPYVFVGVTLGVSVDVVDNNGITLVTYYHEAFAGAIFDPKGNNKAYTWMNSTLMPEARLNRIDHLRIRFSNVS
jgi:hypothetical protein